MSFFSQPNQRVFSNRGKICLFLATAFLYTWQLGASPSKVWAASQSDPKTETSQNVIQAGAYVPRELVQVAEKGPAEQKWRVVFSVGQPIFRPIGSKTETWQYLESGVVLNTGTELKTDGKSTVVLSNGFDMMSIGYDTHTAILRDEAEPGSIKIYQKSGKAYYEVENRQNVSSRDVAPPDGTFEVHTPYLVAVVKGTGFSVDVSEENSTVDVSEGTVGVSDSRSGANADVSAGQTATSGTSSKGGLSVGSTSSAFGGIAAGVSASAASTGQGTSSGSSSGGSTGNDGGTSGGGDSGGNGRGSNSGGSGRDNDADDGNDSDDGGDRDGEGDRDGDARDGDDRDGDDRDGDGGDDKGGDDDRGDDDGRDEDGRDDEGGDDEGGDDEGGDDEGGADEEGGEEDSGDDDGRGDDDDDDDEDDDDDDLQAAPSERGSLDPGSHSRDGGYKR